MEVLFIWVLNFILSSYSYQITDFSVFSGSAIESHMRVEHYLREGNVLKSKETLSGFFERDDIQQAFQEASITWQLRRQDRDRFIMIMNQQQI